MAKTVEVYVLRDIMRDTYEVSIRKKDENKVFVALPVDIGWRELTPEDMGQPMRRFLSIPSDEATDFFTSMLLAARECGVKFIEPLSNELNAIKSERDNLRKIVGKLLKLREIIFEEDKQGE